MVYGLKYTRIFKKQIERVKKKDKALMEELAKKVKKLQDVPYSGKPLKYRLSHYRSLRIKGKYRLIYMVDENESEVILVAFGHREEIYKLMLFSFEEERKE
ncbi:ParE toxin of type II toxin-antitoxin system, parDE [Candidatus Methanoperedenaceae archaeon GB37]|nr:ParE toxin of type II toxin-antitoxin system, parDE [Candidatus Methanoperedenaceae archaeon GB37]